jgi:tetratricopeptide (TPR) repeat protein
LFAIFLAGCATYNLNGMIYDYEGQPVQNFRISIKKNNTVSSDIAGRFYFSNIKKGNYILEGSKDGYESLENPIEVFSDAQVVYLRTASLDNLLKLAYSALSKNQFTEAEGYIKRALGIKPLTAETYFYAAILYFRKGDYEEARNNLDEAEKISPKSDVIKKFKMVLEKEVEVHK